MATNTQVGSYAAICQYLFAVDTIKKAALNGGGLDNIHATALYLVRRSFDHLVDQGLTSEATILNPYLYSLCGAKLQESIYIYNNGNGSVVPGPSPGGSGYVPYPFYHVVTLSEANQTSITNSDWKGLIGFTELVINQNPTFQWNVSFLYDSVTGTLDFDLTSTTGNNYTLQEGDIISSQGLLKFVTN